jgi:hypothetical protein
MNLAKGAMTADDFMRQAGARSEKAITLAQFKAMARQSSLLQIMLEPTAIED